MERIRKAHARGEIECGICGKVIGPYQELLVGRAQMLAHVSCYRQFNSAPYWEIGYVFKEAE